MSMGYKSEVVYEQCTYTQINRRCTLTNGHSGSHSVASGRRKFDYTDLKNATLTLEEIYEVLDEDWLYDLLPGDGQDDYILSELRKRLLFKASESPTNGRKC